MSQTNDITGDRLVSKVPSEAYKNNYDKIFNKEKQVEQVVKAPEPIPNNVRNIK